MAREIKLDGGEISMLKAIGTSGAPVYGKIFLDRVSELAEAEMLETLTGLISLGYVLSNKVNIRKIEEVERAFFRVNPSYSKDLRDAINPARSRGKDRARRQRRG